MSRSRSLVLIRLSGNEEIQLSGPTSCDKYSKQFPFGPFQFSILLDYYSTGTVVTILVLNENETELTSLYSL